MPITPWIAFLSPDQLGVFIPIIALSIPVIAIMSRHQQTMARIIRGQQGDQALRAELEAVKQEVGYLRGVVNSQTLALESIRQKTMETSDPLTQRISSTVE